jgi:hypothetical protein
MIVSHRHRFIFVHLGRTGGRSITAALASHCGPDDIITGVPGVAPQNAEGLERHATAHEIRKLVGEDTWNEYYTFTFERNPWDKILSRYWDYAGQRPRKAYKRIFNAVAGRPLSFREWFLMRVWQGRLFGLGHIRFPRHYGCYTANDRLMVDFIARFENRAEHLSELSDRIGIKIDPAVWIGNLSARKRAPYTEQFDPWMQRIVESVYAKDLEFLGYAFGQPHPTNYIAKDDRKRMAA